jgi:hypothetical protein
VVSSQSLQLGSATLAGNLTLSAIQGNITQVGAVSVAGTTQLQAPEGNLDFTNAANHFAQAVSVITGGSLQLNSNASLTLGQVNVTGLTTITNIGNVDLGSGTFAGKLSVNSNGGEIVQTGPINFKSDTDFNAGNGKIDLYNTGNQWTGAILFTGGTIMINHPVLLGAFANAGMLNSRESTTNSFVTNFTATAHPETSSSSEATALTTSNGVSSNPNLSANSSSVISISVSKAPVDNQASVMTVVVAPEVAMGNKGFSFEIDANILPNSNNRGAINLTATLPDGRNLPDWIKFDPSAHKFSAETVPRNGFPLEVRIRAGVFESIVLIKNDD